MRTDRPAPSLAVPFRSIAECLDRHADAHPDKVAVHDLAYGRSLSFAEVKMAVGLLARLMRDQGVAPGDKVAILSEECLEKLLLMMAAWRAGAVACPFHTEIAPAHLRTILGTIAPALVWWNRNLDGAKLTTGLGCPTTSFGVGDDRFTAAGSKGADGALPPANGPDDLACIFATSGTTDQPKCVAWDHLGLWLCGLSTLDFTAMGPDDRLLEYRTFSWLSPQILAMMPFLAAGLTLYVAPRFSRGRFFDWIRDHRITVAAGVPTVINMLLAEPVAVTAADLPSLRLMTSSSAPLAPDQWRAFEARYGIRLLQLYGASEGGWLCGNRHDRRKIGTVGPPAKHMDLVMVDPAGAPCPPGVEGEITIGGRQTAAAAWSSDGGWRDLRGLRHGERFRTGDLGVMDSDGFVTVTGRVKDLIIRGGVKIAPLEIDAVIMEHPDVAEAAAFAVPDAIYGEDVACFVVPRPGARPDAAAILAHCAGRLPALKTPKHVYFAAELPKNDRGKVRRDALRNLRDGLTPGRR
jgi:acyl-coenzyme A synthetase/AMP-(fatty) acid ligase